MKSLTMIVLSIAAGMAAGQPQDGGSAQRAGEAAVRESPCAGTLDTVGKCWDCFQSLLTDCEKNQTEDKRKACYEGANTFFDWCLGRVADPKARANSQWPGFQNWVVGDQLERPFIWPESADRVEAWVRVPGQRERQPEPAVEQQPDGSFVVVVDWPTMSLGDNGSVGLVLVWYQGDTPVEALADVVLLTSDASGDGTDQEDILRLLAHYSAGTIDTRELIRALD